VEANVAAFKMIFQEAQIFGFDVLENAQRPHDREGSFGRDNRAAQRLAPILGKSYKFHSV
jgi:hypothetical protein